MLATVTRTWGSSPRPVGAMMVLREDGQAVGSVSGGCVQDDLIDRYTTVNRGVGMPSLATDTVRYGVPADEAHRFGLPCGGTIELVLEFAPSLEVLQCLVERLQAGGLVSRSVRLLDGRVHLDYPTVSEPLSFDGKTLTTTHGPAFRMLLIGAGALAEYVCDDGIVQRV